MQRYEDNKGIISESTYTIIKQSHVVIIGVGGLGGFLAESFVRLGVKKLTLIDPDTFKSCNLNRQRFATMHTLGINKVDATKRALIHINPDVNIHALHTSIELCFHDLILSEADLLVDAVDDISTKRYIEQLGKTYTLPVLHGAIGGWYGQFALIKTNYNLLDQYYESAEFGIEKALKCPTFLPPIIANMMVVEWIKSIANDSHFISDTLYYYDAKTSSLDIVFTKHRD